MPRLSAPSRRDCPPGFSPAARSRRGCFPSLHRRIASVPAAARLPLCPISMRHRHPLECRKGRSTGIRHIRTVTCAGSQAVRVRLPRGRLTRDDASYRESERGVGDALSASRSVHGRWLADGPGRAMTLVIGRRGLGFAERMPKTVSPLERAEVKRRGTRGWASVLGQWLPVAWRRGGRRNAGNKPGAREGPPSWRDCPLRPDGPGGVSQVGLPLARPAVGDIADCG